MSEAKEDFKIEKQKKYWIEDGMAVAHVDRPSLKIRVEKVKKISKSIKNEAGKEITRTFISGVLCHWIDKDDKFQKGMFRTTELVQWDSKDHKQLLKK